MNKYILSIVSITIIVLGLAYISNTKVSEVQAAGVAGPSFLVASSTDFTVTTSSIRLLSTTTPQGQSGARVSATVQPINCTAGGSGAFLSLNGNISATANNGLLAFASSTLILGDHLNQVPVVRGPINAITAVGTCTVLVTEWVLQ